MKLVMRVEVVKTVTAEKEVELDLDLKEDREWLFDMMWKAHSDGLGLYELIDDGVSPSQDEDCHEITIEIDEEEGDKVPVLVHEATKHITDDRQRNFMKVWELCNLHRELNREERLP